jgi:hypothetical protein
MPGHGGKGGKAGTKPAVSPPIVTSNVGFGFGGSSMMYVLLAGTALVAAVYFLKPKWLGLKG